MPHILVLVALVATAACGSTPSAAPPAPAASVAAAPAVSTPAASADAGVPTPASMASAANDGDGQAVSGTVAETMNSGGYTYARLSGDKGDTWVATTEMALEKGAKVSATVSVVMDNFHSRTLNRDFAKIAFVSDLIVNGVAVAPSAGAESGAAAGAPPMVGSHGGGGAKAAAAGGSPRPPAGALVEKVAPASGGLTVFQVWQKRADLSGKTVVVRGRIVKANFEIMGSNWYHLQDGTGDLEAGTHDLTFTSRDRANVGDVVTISGPIALGKDFGAGYAYDVMVEGAAIKDVARQP